MSASASYLTPSPSANRDGVNFGQAQYTTPSKPMNIDKPHQPKEEVDSKWPTPPYEENDWAASATASIFATATMYR
jgi:meiosis induction protein kinase IME2/SME1